LRTRKSLSVQRLAKFVARKLGDESMVIVLECKGRVLPPYMTLADVISDVWREVTATPTLYYALKEEQTEHSPACTFVALPSWVDTD
jgi:hypothetical protein